MSAEARITDLIETERDVLESDFDPIALDQWRHRAFVCLTETLGPDHGYTRQFENYVRQGVKTDLLVSAGILSAAQHGIAGRGLELIAAITNPNAAPDLTGRTPGRRNGMR
ncbi:MAG: hypothetical protein V1792_22820, partial [Pseudomonadota bacterium]